MADASPTVTMSPPKRGPDRWQHPPKDIKGLGNTQPLNVVECLRNTEVRVMNFMQLFIAGPRIKVKLGKACSLAPLTASIRPRMEEVFDVEVIRKGEVLKAEASSQSAINFLRS